MRIFLLVTLAFLTNSLLAQALTLDEILLLKSMDSIQLRKFSTNKGFKLKFKQEDNWIYSHTYRSQTDFNISFIRTFPKDTTGTRFVYYYFNQDSIYKAFKKQLKERKFRFNRNHTDTFGLATFSGDIYVTKKDEIDLSSEKITGEKTTYCLLYYDRLGTRRK